MKKHHSPNIILIMGGQWGDEGKGKIVDKYVEMPNRVQMKTLIRSVLYHAPGTSRFVDTSKNFTQVEMMYRHHGGDNAGHTVQVEKNTYKLHCLPSGIVRRGMKCCVGPYVVCNLELMGEELALADSCGSEVFLDPRAPVILPIHRLIDRGREQAKGKDAIGTTQRGIGPAYEDLISRRSLTLGDLVSPDRIRTCLLNGHYYEERAVIARFLDQNPPSVDDTVDYCFTRGKLLVPHLADTRRMLYTYASHSNIPVLFEGAHGVMLDLLHGAPPYITSSLCSAGSVATSYGVMPQHVVTVVKAYTTRVGAGPFPTELTDALGDHLREKGHEFGTTTGRPRRCGWLDLVAVAYAMRMGGGTHIALTKLDVLTGLDEIKICTGYRMPSGEILPPFATLTREILETATPIYKSFRSWHRDISNCHSLNELPRTVWTLLDFIQEHLLHPITLIGVGPERNQVIWVGH